MYIFWGSTYLAIAFAIETIPPLTMAAARFLLAGLSLYGWLRIRGARAASHEEWYHASIIGVLLLTIGSGGVAFAEQWVPSGIAALIIATVAFWLVLFEWLMPRGSRPGAVVVVGLILGFGGVALLVGPAPDASSRLHTGGVAMLLVAATSWALGSIYSRGVPQPRSPLVGPALQMIVAGVVLAAGATLRGEMELLRITEISRLSWLSLGYLVVFGSLVSYSAYIWLLQHTTPARVATYAYVNPVVAVALGYAIAGEQMTSRMLVAISIIIAAVALITTARARQQTPTK